MRALNRCKQQVRCKPYLVTLIASTLLMACQHTPVPMGMPEKLYDFDHQVHYEQTKYNDDHYLLKIKPDSYQFFLQQSVFLLRHAKRLCQGSTPQLTLLQGVQTFETLPTKPRPYQNDLTTEIKCVETK
jgi:hypothetical protein